MKLFAPAKVNLYLKIVGKRDDGYHLLDTLLVPISLGDDIEVLWASPGAPPITLTTGGIEVPAGQENLAYRAAQLFLEEVAGRVSRPLHIRLYKRTPVGGGLGGGSSDAAATLVGLNSLTGAGLSEETMVSLALRLGADVPFFISGRAARGRGIGDQLSSVGPLPTLWIVLLYPNFEVSTAWVYRNFGFKLTKSFSDNNLFESLGTPEKVARVLLNDLETVTIRRYPDIIRLKERLIETGALGSLMSGSGSSVFGIYATQHAAREAYATLEEYEDTHAYLVSSLT
jgi:4-diphosphocytidyl-2-C-methyl-D-erythritol kinase